MTKLSALGFCGADDSVNPRHLALLAQSYPNVEWGILFRPDKEGLPRYATLEWVRRLAAILKITDNDGSRGRLAAHLCGAHVNDLLSSSTDDSSAQKIDAFLTQLYEWGFRRVQVNATAVNGVFTDNLSSDSTMLSFLRTVVLHDKMEFIVQKNQETEPLWEGLLAKENRPQNMVFLHDESKGTGKEAGGFCEEERFVATERRIVGFAGGIKPTNVKSSIEKAIQACNKSEANEFWIDMESGVRTTINDSDGSKQDIFDLAKCFECIDIVCGMGLMEHPQSLR